MGLIIRPADKGDFAAVSSIIQEGQEEHAEAMPRIFARTNQALNKGWYHSFLDRDDKRILVAEHEGDVAGIVMMEIQTSPPYETLVPSKIAHILELAVARNKQRQGIGRSLVEAAREWAKEQGADRMELTVWEFNAKAVAFYEAVGLLTLRRTMYADLN